MLEVIPKMSDEHYDRQMQAGPYNIVMEMP